MPARVPERLPALSRVPAADIPIPALSLFSFQSPMNANRLHANIVLRRCRKTQLLRHQRRFISTNLSSSDTRLHTTSQPVILPTSTAVPIRATVTATKDTTSSDKIHSDNGRHLESPLARYQAMVDEGTLRKDDHQTRIIEKLQHLYENVLSYTAPPIPPQPLKSDSFVSCATK
jgi:protein AFG1